MKKFEMRDVAAAIQYAKDGGQALHLHTINQGHPLFRRYSVIAHLFDQDKERLVQTAKKLGVRVIKVGSEGERGQHIDLCGRPFEKAVEMCEKLPQLNFL